MASARNKKIAEEIKKIVGSILISGLKDPRISKLSSVTRVEVTGDLRYATIYISVFDPGHDVEETLEGLRSAKGFIRKSIGSRLKLYYTPEPIFKADHSVEYGMHINDLIGKINRESAEKDASDFEEEASKAQDDLDSKEDEA